MFCKHKGGNSQRHTCFGKVLVKSAEVHYVKNFLKVTKVSTVMMY